MPSPSQPPPIRPSSRQVLDARGARRLAGEALAARELGRLALHAPWLTRAPRGHGQPVVLLPGLAASDTSNAALRGYLRSLGYDVHGWGIGRNRGDVTGSISRVRQLTTRLAERSGEQVHLIGWSLGGVVARGVARVERPTIAQVITYGSPVLDRGLRPVRVPITAIYSKGDGIVPWRSCIDDFSPEVENIEVRSAHLGMGIDPDVWRIVTDRLARVAPAARR